MWRRGWAGCMSDTFTSTVRGINMTSQYPSNNLSRKHKKKKRNSHNIIKENFRGCTCLTNLLFLLDQKTFHIHITKSDGTIAFCFRSWGRGFGI